MGTDKLKVGTDLVKVGYLVLCSACGRWQQYYARVYVNERLRDTQTSSFSYRCEKCGPGKS